jgi:hypothetical protein
VKVARGMCIYPLVTLSTGARGEGGGGTWAMISHIIGYSMALEAHAHSNKNA